MQVAFSCSPPSLVDVMGRSTQGLGLDTARASMRAHAQVCKNRPMLRSNMRLSVSQRFRAGAPVLGSPERTRQYLRHQIGTLPYEVFGLLLLDTRHRLIPAEIL